MTLESLLEVLTPTNFAFAMLSAALFLAFARLVRGPSLPDRVVALDLMGTLAVGVIAVQAIQAGQPVSLDVAIVVALIVFLGTAAFAQYLERRGRGE